MLYYKYNLMHQVGETNHTEIETKRYLKRILFTVCVKQSRDEVSTLPCVAVVTLALMSVTLFHCYSLVPVRTFRLHSLHIHYTFTQ